MPIAKRPPEDLRIYTGKGAQAAALPALASLFQQMDAAGLVGAAYSHPGGEDDRRRLAKRRHDLKAALRTLTFTVNALATGYTFQDASAAAKIEAIGRAVQVLEREGEVLARLFTVE